VLAGFLLFTLPLDSILPNPLESGYSVLDLLHVAQFLAEPITMITRLRLDAALYDPAPPRKAGMRGRPRLKGKRLPTLAQVLHDPTTVWQLAKANWYEDKEPAWRSPQTQQYGFIVAKHPCLFAGCSSGTRWECSSLRLCFALTLRSFPNRSSLVLLFLVTPVAQHG
jgi:hypothetical protein